MSKKTVGVLALLGATVCWGLGPVMTKVGLLEIPPFSLAFLRILLSISLILPYVIFKGLLKIKKKDLWSLLTVGAFGSGFNTIFFLWGVSKTSAAASATIFALAPLVNGILASIILKEKPKLIRILGVAIGFLGSILIALEPVISGNKINGDLWGDLLIIGAVFCWVFYIIGSKQLLQKYPPLTIICFSYFSAIIIISPLFLLDFINFPNWYLKLGTDGLIGISYGGLISGVVAFTLFQWGIQYTSAFEAGMFIYLQPVLTDISAILVLGEKLIPIFLLGSSLILGGVFLTTTYELIKRKREE